MAAFKDQTAPPKRIGKINPPSGIKNPCFDKRTGSTLACGDDYGVGRRTPVGKTSVSSIESGPIPMKSKCFRPSEAINE